MTPADARDLLIHAATQPDDRLRWLYVRGALRTLARLTDDELSDLERDAVNRAASAQWVADYDAREAAVA